MVIMRKNRNYIILAILTAIFLFATAATCNQCGTPIEIKIGAEEVEEPAEIEEPEEDDPKETTEEAVTASEEEVSEEEEQIIELPKEELTDDQLQLLSMFGYPDEYVIVFDEGNNNIRIEVWIFEAMQSSFTFEGGKYSGSEMVITPMLLPDNYNIRPEEFVYPMTPDEVGLLIGEDGYQITETNTGIKTIIYGEGIIVCTYNTDDLLVYVSRSKNVEITED